MTLSDRVKSIMQVVLEETCRELPNGVTMRAGRSLPNSFLQLPKPGTPPWMNCGLLRCVHSRAQQRRHGNKEALGISLWLRC